MTEQIENKKDADRLAELRNSSDPAIQLIMGEIARNETAVRRTWYFGLALTCVVGVYFTWIVGRTQDVVLNPNTLGQAAAVAVDRAFPELLARTESALTDNPQAFATKATDAISALMSLSRVKAEKQIAKLPSAIANAREPLMIGLRKVAAEHGDEIQALYKSGKSDKEIATEVARMTMLGAVSGLDGSLRNYTGNAGLAELSGAALDVIQRADAHFAHLAALPAWRLSHRDGLERRTVAAWFNIIEARLQEAED